MNYYLQPQNVNQTCSIGVQQLSALGLADSNHNEDDASTVEYNHNPPSAIVNNPYLTGENVTDEDIIFCNPFADEIALNDSLSQPCANPTPSQISTYDIADYYTELSPPKTENIAFIDSKTLSLLKGNNLKQKSNNQKIKANTVSAFSGITELYTGIVSGSLRCSRRTKRHSTKLMQLSAELNDSPSPNDNSRNFICHCGRSFTRKYNLETHRITHSANRSKPFECTFTGCQKTFGRRHDLARHISSVSFMFFCYLF